ncbi:hypothetical protein [Xanthomonas phage RTH11]|nr:hypothetical protein [Xanthomonas phage RTH11]
MSKTEEFPGFYFIEHTDASPYKTFIEVGDISHPERRLQLGFRAPSPQDIEDESYQTLTKDSLLVDSYELRGLEQTDNCRLPPAKLIAKLLRTLGILKGKSLSDIYLSYDIAANIAGVQRFYKHSEETHWQSLDSVSIVRECEVLRTCGWQFQMRGIKIPHVMLHDPEPVPFMEEWRDNIGSMANAVPWLMENWEPAYNATGVHFHGGHRWMWNWSPSTEVLMIHTTEQGEHGAIRYQITLNQIIRYDGPSEHWYTIYRPFLGQIWNDPSQLAITWMKTQEVIVQSYHERGAIPLNKRELVLRVERLLGQAPIGAYPLIKFSLPVSGRSINRKERVTTEQAMAYSDLIHQLKITSDGASFVDHHMPSYWALRANIAKFCEVMGWLKDWTEDNAPYPRGMYHDEIDRLLDMGEFHAAALLQTFLHEQGDIACARGAIRLRRGMPDQ